jgi:hypothetical protein
MQRDEGTMEESNLTDIPNSIIFEIITQLKFPVRTTREYWDLITTIKHPNMVNRIEDVKMTLFEPDLIKRSKNDANVYLFYRKTADGKWLCVVVKKQKENGFIITTYITDAIKEGTLIWTK